MPSKYTSALVLALLSLSSPSAWACSCAYATTSELYSEATSVFLGSITKAQLKPGSGGFSGKYDSHIEVTYSLIETFKGSPDAEGVVLDTIDLGGNCSINFVVSRVYVIFLYGDKTAGHCGGTRSTRGEPIVDELRALRDSSGV